MTTVCNTKVRADKQPTNQFTDKTFLLLDQLAKSYICDLKMFKNILLLSLVVGLTVPKDVFHFVVHIPAYIHHFHHHNTEHRHISLADFINEHSSDTNHHDHDNLPFNHNHSSYCNQSLTFIPFYSRQTINFHLPAADDKKVIAQQFFRSSAFSPSIWQPPKIS